MIRRVIKEHELQVLMREIHYLEESQILSAEKVNEIQALYEAKEKVSFTRTLLYAGSILIGAGILSFIASNWTEIGKTVKFLLIIGIFLGCNLAGYKLETHYPKTSKSFYYLGVMVFGAGIFLVGQMFNLGGSFQNAFLWWSIGILPLAWVLRDQWILLAASVFVLIHMMDGPYLEGEIVPLWTLLLIFMMYILNEKIGFSRITGFVIGILPLVLIGSVISFLTSDFHKFSYMYNLIYLIIGIALVLAKGKVREVYVFLGYLVQGGAAVLLSFQDAWPLDWLYLPFSLLYLLFVLYLIKRGSLLSIIILCIMIFRFYLDISFAFLPKSFVFIIGGILLLGFGFYFEKQRKKGGRVHE